MFLGERLLTVMEGEITCDFPSRAHHCSPVIVLLLSSLGWSEMAEWLAGGQSSERGAAFLGPRLALLWLIALYQVALFWDKHLTTPLSPK